MNPLQKKIVGLLAAENIDAERKKDASDNEFEANYNLGYADAMKDAIDIVNETYDDFKQQLQNNNNNSNK